MKRLATTALVILATGCGGSFPDAGRLEVNDELRLSCPQWNDQQIAGALLAIEADRTSGFTKEFEVYSWMSSANQAGGDSEATLIGITCGMAIINQVYGG